MKRFSLILGAGAFFLTVGAQAVLADGPVQPFSFQAGAGATPGTVNLQWADPTGLANNYALVYGTTAGSYSYGALNIPEGLSGVTTFTVGSLQPGQQYFFGLVGLNGSQFVANSGPVSATATGGTVAASGAVGPVTVTTPFGFKAVTGGSTGTVNLAWVDSLSLANRYSIMYGPSSGNYIYGVPSIAETPGVNTFTVGALNSGATYFFRLVAWNGSSWVFTSVEVSATAK